MMCSEDRHSKKFWVKKIIFIPIAMAAGMLVFGGLVMFLWNALLPQIFGISAITFWQAIGILLLSKILFGGFPGKNRRHHIHRHEYELIRKFRNLSPEEKEKIRKEYWERFDCKS